MGMDSPDLLRLRLAHARDLAARIQTLRDEEDVTRLRRLFLELSPLDRLRLRADLDEVAWLALLDGIEPEVLQRLQEESDVAAAALRHSNDQARARADDLDRQLAARRQEAAELEAARRQVEEMLRRLDEER